MAERDAPKPAYADPCMAVAAKFLRRLESRLDDSETPIPPGDYRHISAALKDIRDVLAGGRETEGEREIRVVIDGGEDYVE